VKGVITIAGYGTRFLPASKAVPKEMFPIAGIPLIQYHVESLVAAGITEIIIVVRDGSEAVRRHFAPDASLDRHLEKMGKGDLLERVQRTSRLADIVFVRQPETLPYGNASPALAARPWLSPGEPFYYMFGDDMIIGDVPVPQQVLDAYRQFQPAAVVATQWISDKEIHLYGCVELKPGSTNEMKQIVEKPAPGTAPSNWAVIGHYILTPELFDVLGGSESELGKGGELWLADAVDRMAASRSVIAQPIDGLWMAAGDPLRQLKANIEMSLRQDDMREELIAYLRSLEL
jgi:UTP--glucose-1-phosphate uridylyltransferase